MQNNASLIFPSFSTPLRSGVRANTGEFIRFNRKEQERELPQRTQKPRIDDF
jgi:hypothetical protein